MWYRRHMNILLVNYEYKPQCGGAGLGTYNMARAFRQMGHEVDLLIGWDYNLNSALNYNEEGAGAFKLNALKIAL